MVRLAGFDWESFADAEGVSCVLFISGCLHNCEGCHSPQTHDFKYGIEITDKVIEHINSEIDKRPFLSALVLSGGDPMYSAKELIPILSKIHIPNNNIWCYSGFTLKEIQSNPDMAALLNLCTHLVDGQFEIEKRDITLNFRGSSNQNVWKKENDIWMKQYGKDD
jgi:anaerobic ribonucleoside-triphosphate reductase activating protein